MLCWDGQCLSWPGVNHSHGMLLHHASPPAARSFRCCSQAIPTSLAGSWETLNCSHSVEGCGKFCGNVHGRSLLHLSSHVIVCCLHPHGEQRIMKLSQPPRPGPHTAISVLLLPSHNWKHQKMVSLPTFPHSSYSCAPSPSSKASPRPRSSCSQIPQHLWGP